MMLKKLGLEMILDISECHMEKTNNLVFLKSIIRTTAKMMQTVVIGEIHHTFTPHGITIMAIIADSHIAIHTWPEYNHVSIDIFSCKRCIPTTIIEYLSIAFETNDISVQEFDRTMHL